MSTAIEVRLHALEKEAAENKLLLHGNGRKGLVQEVATMQGSVKSIESSAKSFADTAHRIQADQTRFVERQATATAELRSETKGLVRSVAGIKKQTDKVEKGLSHITEWRKALMIRVGTIIGVYGSLFTVLGAIFLWFWKNREAIAEYLTK